MKKFFVMATALGLVLGLAVNSQAEEKTLTGKDAAKAVAEKAPKAAKAAAKAKATNDAKATVVNKAPKAGVYKIKVAGKVVGQAKYSRAAGFSGIPADIKGKIMLEAADGNVIETGGESAKECDPKCDENQYCLKGQCIDET